MFIPSLAYIVLKYFRVGPEWRPHAFHCFVTGLFGQVCCVWPFAAKPALVGDRQAMWISFFRVTGFGVQVLRGFISVLSVA